jgi:hypothetical protein
MPQPAVPSFVTSLRRSALLALCLGLSAGTASADIALLSNGMTFKVTGQRQEGETVFLTLKDGGEVGTPASMLRGVVPDEVVEEVARAVSEVTGGPAGDIRALATAAARRHGLDPELVLAVIGAESNFRPGAVSPKGARGLMQLMPATAREMGVTDILDPAANVDGGTKYLKQLLELYGGDMARALAAYNAGPGAVARHRGIPPYRETQHYVKKVLRSYESAREPDKRK